jgi:hypothetical protein
MFGNNMIIENMKPACDLTVLNKLEKKELEGR